MIPSKTYGTMYYVNKMSEAVSYYKQVLATEPSYASDDWTEFEIAGHNLCLHCKRAGENYNANGVLILYRDGIQTLHDSMKADGYNVYGLHQIHGEMHSFNFKDKSNNELSFYGKIN